jgi:parallel beta-helix repeat protein
VVRLAAAAAIALLAGCELFVSVPEPAAIRDGSSGGCDGNQACAPPLPVCELETHTCVECNTSADCATGACTSHVCAPCHEDADCDSAVCLPDGSCAAASRILYASPAGSGSDCSTATPCSLDAAAVIVAPDHDIIKLAPGTYPRTTTLTITAPAIITGYAATIEASLPGTTFLFTASATQLTLIGITTTGTTNGAAQCDTAGRLELFRTRFTGGRIGAFGNGCEVKADRVVISSAAYYAFYMLGGGPVTLTNSYLTRNGGISTIAGVFVSDITAGTIDHTTIADNTAANNGQSGIRCSNSPNVTIRNSIIYGNKAPSIDGACNVSYSVIDPGFGGGTNNVQLNPMFVAPLANDYHLAPASPARGLGDPASTRAIDFDGDPRPLPAGSPSDPGADEIP